MDHMRHDRYGRGGRAWRLAALVALAALAGMATASAADATLVIRNTTSTNIVVGGVTILRGGRHAFTVPAETPGVLEGFGGYPAIHAGMIRSESYPPKAKKPKVQDPPPEPPNPPVPDDAVEPVPAENPPESGTDDVPPPPPPTRYIFRQPPGVPPLAVRQYNRYLAVHDGDELRVYPNDRDSATEEKFKLFRLNDACAECRQDWKVVLPADAVGDVDVSPEIARKFPPAKIEMSFHLLDAPEADAFYWRPDGQQEWRLLDDNTAIEKIGGSYVKFEVPVHTRIDFLAKREGCEPIVRTVDPLCYGEERREELLSFEADPWPHPPMEQWDSWTLYEVPFQSFHMTWMKLYDILRDRCATEMPMDEFFGWLAKAGRNHSLRQQWDHYLKRVESGVEPAGIYLKPGTQLYYPGRVLFREPAGEEAEVEAAEPAEESASEPAEEAVADAAEEPVEEPAEEPTEEPAAEPTEEAVANAADESVEESAVEEAAEPVEESAAESAEETAEAPDVEPVEEPAEASAEETAEASADVSVEGRE